MAARIRRHTGKGRTPWYTIYVGGKDRHLGTDPASAHARAAELLKGRSPTGPPVTVRGLCLAWIAAGRPAWQVARLGDWAEAMPLVDLMGLQGYADYLVAAGLKPASIRDYCRHARACLQWAADQGWPATVPPMPRTLPKRVRQPRDIDPAVLRAALERIRYAKHIIRFIAATACRPSEACNLQWPDVSMRTATATLRHHKTAHHGKTRTQYLTPAALAVLAEVTTKSGPVFLNRHGKPYTPSGLRSILRRLGIPGAYCLRHTAAQDWLDQGTDFGVVAGLLGHSDLRTVQVYAQVRDRRLSAAARGLRGME